jgi:holo-[acyl-carrier protein] synthase
MIFGTGVDIVEIQRFEKLINRHNSLKHIFGEEELEQLAQSNRVASFAANFCAKEAFAKALGTGVRGFKLNEVEILRDDLGKPFYKLSGSAKKITDAAKLKFHVSLSHSLQFAIAFTVAESDF